MALPPAPAAIGRGGYVKRQSAERAAKWNKQSNAIKRVDKGRVNVVIRSHSMLFSNVAIQTEGQSMTTSELPVGPVSLQLAAGSNDGEKSTGHIGDQRDQVSK